MIGKSSSRTSAAKHPGSPPQRAFALLPRHADRVGHELRAFGTKHVRSARMDRSQAAEPDVEEVRQVRVADVVVVRRVSRSGRLHLGGLASLVLHGPRVGNARSPYAPVSARPTIPAHSREGSVSTKSHAMGCAWRARHFGRPLLSCAMSRGHNGLDELYAKVLRRRRRRRLRRASVGESSPSGRLSL